MYDESILQYLEKNNSHGLSKYVPEMVNPDHLIPEFRIRNISRKQTPLLIVAVAYKAYECAQYLIANGANIECEDNVNEINLMEYFCCFFKTCSLGMHIWM